MTDDETLVLCVSYAGTILAIVGMCSWHVQGDVISDLWWLILAFCLACNVYFTLQAWHRHHRKD